MVIIREEEVEAIRDDYPKGTRVEFCSMREVPQKVPKGTLGTVTHVDDIGSIHVTWDNGSSLAVIPWVDTIRKVTARVIVRNPDTKLIMSNYELSQWANDVNKIAGGKGNLFSSANFPERLAGHHCNCGVTEDGYSKGVFELIPLHSEAVREGGKAYMRCTKCGGYSHL